MIINYIDLTLFTPVKYNLSKNKLPMIMQNKENQNYNLRYIEWYKCNLIKIKIPPILQRKKPTARLRSLNDHQLTIRYTHFLRCYSFSNKLLGKGKFRTFCLLHFWWFPLFSYIVLFLKETNIVLKWPGPLSRLKICTL